MGVNAGHPVEPGGYLWASPSSEAGTTAGVHLSPRPTCRLWRSRSDHSRWIFSQAALISSGLGSHLRAESWDQIRRMRRKICQVVNPQADAICSSE
jgi:hypothetical protein